jgi:serine/threonine-protein kinase RsbW
MDLPTLARRYRAAPDEVRHAREDVAEYARTQGVVDLEAVALAVSEAVTNVIVHAYLDAPQPGEIEVSARSLPDDGLQVEVRDTGRGMLPRPDSPGLGLGLALIGKLAAEFEVLTNPGGGTLLRMAFSTL